MEIKAEKLVEEASKLILPVMTKPHNCPFCGGYASLISEYDVESDQSFYYVYCTKCGVEQAYYSKTAEEAIKKWNTRTEKRTGWWIREEGMETGCERPFTYYYCSNCGKPSFVKDRTCPGCGAEMEQEGRR